MDNSFVQISLESREALTTTTIDFTLDVKREHEDNLVNETQSLKKTELLIEDSSAPMENNCCNLYSTDLGTDMQKFIVKREFRDFLDKEHSNCLTQDNKIGIIKKEEEHEEILYINGEIQSGRNIEPLKFNDERDSTSMKNNCSILPSSDLNREINKNIVKEVPNGRIDKESSTNLFQDTKIEIVEHLLEKDIENFIVEEKPLPKNGTFKKLVVNIERMHFDKFEGNKCTNFCGDKDRMVNTSSRSRKVINKNSNAKLLQNDQIIQGSQENQSLYKSVNKKYLAKERKKGNVIQTRYTCSVCLITVAGMENFNKHLNSFHKNNKNSQNPPNIKRLFQCPECPKNVSSKCSLDMHIFANHPDKKNAMITITSKIHVCELCEFKTIKRENINKHIQIHHGAGLDKKYQCDTCNYRTHLRYQLNIHSRIHTELKLFSCKLCNEKFKTKTSLDNHIVKNHSKDDEAISTVTKKVHSCEICDYKTVRRGRLNSHIQMRHGIVASETFYCDVCDYRTVEKSNLKLHMKRHTEERPLLPCQICKKNFISKIGLNCHVVRNHSRDEKAMIAITNKIHSCDFCEFKTISDSRLKIHLRMHEDPDVEGKEKFYCAMCDYKSTIKKHLKCHIESHSNQRDFPCQLCDSKFKNKSGLQGHIVAKHPDNQNAMSIVTQKIHSCKICEYKTLQKLALKLHIHKHALLKGMENFQCDICGFKTNYKTHLKKHIHRHFEVEYFTCQICNKKLKSKVYLEGHMVTKHSENVSINTTKKVFSCEMCEYKTLFMCKFKAHQQKHAGVKTEKNYQCHLCDYKAANKYVIKKHISKHMDLRPFPCPLCNKHFKSSYALEGHIVAKHSKDEKAMSTVTRKFNSCKFCDFKTVNSNCLNTHLMTHMVVVEADQKFECYTCGYKTIHKNCLRSHIQAHTGLRAFHCQACSLKFKFKKHLDCHIVAKHARNKKAMSTLTSKLHSCQLCEFKTLNFSRFKLHLQAHEGVEDKKFQCDLCDYKSIHKSNLKTHISRKHTQK